DWRNDNDYLRNAIEIPLPEIRSTHTKVKRRLCDHIKKTEGIDWSDEVFTIGFARRAATYKRADLLFWDTKRLQEIAEQSNGLQIVFAGKAHPKDEGGKQLIANIFGAKAKIDSSRISVVYLENYTMVLGQLLTAGVD